MASETNDTAAGTAATGAETVHESADLHGAD